MSFAKARIHRFNEEASCAPPPGAYDPKFDDKGKPIPTIHTSERFPEKKMVSESQSLCSSTESLDSYTSSIKPFRTPQLPRRRIPLTPALSSSKLDKIFSRPKGCSTSSAEIKQKMDTKQKEIDDLKEALETLQAELAQKRADEERLMETHTNHINALSDAHTQISSKLHLTEAKLSVATQELEDLKRANDELQSSIKQKQQTILSVQAAMSDMGLKMSDMRTCYEQEKANIVKENLIEHTKQQELIEELEGKMKNERHDYIKYIEELNSQIFELETRESHLEHELEKEKDVTSQLEGQLSQLQSQQLVLESQVSELQKEKKDVEIVIFDKEILISTLAGEKTKLEYELIEVLQEKETLKTKLDESECKLKRTKDNEAELQEQVVSLQKQLDEMQIEKDKAMIETANTMLELSLKHEERLQTMRESLENRLSALQCNLTEDESNYSGLQAWLADHLDTLQNNMASELSNIEANNEARLNDLHNTYSGIESKIKNVRCTLHSRISKYTAESESKYNQIVDRLASKKKKAEAERDDLRSVTESQEATIREQEANLLLAQKECKSLLVASKNAQAAVEALSSRLEEAGTQIESLQKSETASLEEKKKLAEIIKDKEMAYTKLEKCMNELELGLIKETKQVHDKLQNEVEVFKEIVKSEKKIYEDKLDESLKYQLILGDKVSEYDAIVSIQRLEIQSLKSKLETTNEELTELKETHRKISAKVSAFYSSQGQCEEANDATTCDSLERCFENAQNNAAMIDQLNALLVEKEKIIQELEANCSDLNEKFENLENHSNDLLGKKEDQLQQLGSYKESMDSAQNEINCLTAEKDSLNCRIAGLKHEIEALTKLSVEKDKTNESLAKDLSLKNETIEIMTKDIIELNKTLENQQLLLSEAHKSLGDKQCEIVELETSNETLHNMLKEKEDCTAQVTEKEKLIKELIKEKTQIKNDYAQKVEYLETLNSEYFEKLQELENISQCLKDELKELEIEKCLNQKLSDENKCLQEQLDKLKDEKESLKVVVSSSSYNLQLMSEKMTDLNKTMSEVEELRAELKTKNEKLQQVENDLKAVTERKNEYKAFALEIQQDGSALETQKRINEDLQKKCDELETLIGPFRKHLEEYESENKLLESTNEAYQEEKKALLMKFADLLGHQNPKQKIKYINKIIDSNNELTKEVERLKKQMKKLRGADKANLENGLIPLKLDGNSSPRSLKVDKPPLRERN